MVPEARFTGRPHWRSALKKEAGLGHSTDPTGHAAALPGGAALSWEVTVCGWPEQGETPVVRLGHRVWKQKMGTAP